MFLVLPPAGTACGGSALAAAALAAHLKAMAENSVIIHRPLPSSSPFKAETIFS